jgi:hypothetical protein
MPTFLNKLGSLKLNDDGTSNISKNEQEANRCPLCHEDVYPAGEDGWKQHILIETCPNNERHP